MVKFRGIEICIISQFDICKLPEFQYRSPSQLPDPFQDMSHGSSSPFPYLTASSYVPIYPGSQIWFEYSIDGPHPEGSAYFFKLYLNGKAITSWDCTAKHGFHGKMMYNLVNECTDPYTGQSMVRRQALRFGDGLEESDRGGSDEDLVQIDVYRIEHRKRLRDLEEGLGSVDIKSTKADGLRLTNSGLLKPGFRPRRYKYQLLDPIDMPYAVFRFHCRPYEYLEDMGIVRLRDCPSPCSSVSTITSDSSSNRWDPSHGDIANSENLEEPQQSTGTKSPQAPRGSPVHVIGVDDLIGHQVTQNGIRASQSSAHIPISDSDDSLSVRTKDSIEELSSAVPRSPKSSRSPKKDRNEIGRGIAPEMPPSPSRSPGSARQRLKKKLTVNINGADFDIERRKRPLSPFTSGGVLRKSSLPQTAPAAVTEFGPTVDEEVRSRLQKSKPGPENTAEKNSLRTTSAERSGKKLMGFLGRRIAHDKKA